MKKKITMICILKSGQKVTDCLVFKKSDTYAIRAVEQMRLSIENYLTHPDKYKENAGCFTWGKSAICMSEIAAITFKER